MSMNDYAKMYVRKLALPTVSKKIGVDRDLNVVLRAEYQTPY